MQKLFILDYDNTIADSRMSPSKNILKILSTLLKDNKVAILTGGRSIKRLKELILTNTKLTNSPLLRNLYLSPEYGNTIFTWENDWYVVYQSSDIGITEVRFIEKELKKIKWRKYVEKGTSRQKLHDKGSLISVNCLGNNATDYEKENWDKNREIRRKIKKELEKELKNNYEIFITGRNTIDIVPRGRNKADNILKLLKITSTKLENSLYIGDEFNPDGNDYPILSLDIEIHQVNNPKETESILKEYL